MKTEMEKMRRGEAYAFTDEAMLESLHRANRLCVKLNTLTMEDADYRATLEELVPGIDGTSSICPPFYCDHGHGIIVGEHTFINRSCDMLDEGFIRIGARCKVGPDCRFYTVNHPLDYRKRREPCELALPIEIGDDVWIGGGVTICPGVRIGSRSVIAAGSVVCSDIPEDSLAAGNPARVKRKLIISK